MDLLSVVIPRRIGFLTRHPQEDDGRCSWWWFGSHDVEDDVVNRRFIDSTCLCLDHGLVAEGFVLLSIRTNS